MLTEPRTRRAPRSLMALALALLPAPAAHALEDYSPWRTTRWSFSCALPNDYDAQIDSSDGCRFEGFRATGTSGGSSYALNAAAVAELIGILDYSSQVYDGWGLADPHLPTEGSGDAERLVFRLQPESIAFAEDAQGNRVEERIEGVYRAEMSLLYPDMIREGWLEISIGDDSGATTLPALRLMTATHELFHAIQARYGEELPEVAPIRDAYWIEEGMADAVARIILHAHANGLSAEALMQRGDPGFNLTDGYVTGRFNNVAEGLFVGESDAAYDTSYFWADLLTRQMQNPSAVTDLYETASSWSELAPQIVDAWILQEMGQSLPGAFRDFLAEATRPEGRYASVASTLLDCEERVVPLPAGQVPDLAASRLLATDHADYAGNLRVACRRFAMDTDNGPITLTLSEQIDALPLSPHAVVLVNGEIMAPGESMTFPAAPGQEATVAVFFSSLDAYTDASKVETSPVELVFEHTPLVACEDQETLLGTSILSPDFAMRFYPEAADDPNAVWGSGVVTSGPVAGAICVRAIRHDYASGTEALTLVMAGNPSDGFSIDTMALDRVFDVVLSARPEDFAPSSLRADQTVTLTHRPGIGERSYDRTRFFGLTPYFNTIGDASAFSEEFFQGSAMTNIVLDGLAMDLRIEEIGQQAIAADFSLHAQDDTGQIVTAGGYFAVPFDRITDAPSADWIQTCRRLAVQHLFDDAILCAEEHDRAHPDMGTAALDRVMMEMSILDAEANFRRLYYPAYATGRYAP